MTINKIPQSEIANRLANLKNYMAKQNIEAMLLTHKPDIYYFSGTAQDCFLYVRQSHEPVLFVKRYMPRVQKETSIEVIVQIPSIKTIPGLIKDLHQSLPDRCGMAFDVLPVRDLHFYEKLFSPIGFVDGTTCIEKCRQIKSSWEIGKLIDSANLSKKTYGFIEENIKPGYSEMEFCGIFETFARKYGHSGIMLMRNYRSEGYSFHLLSGESGGLPGALDSPVCGTGTSSAYPYGAGPKKLERNEPILIDFSTMLDGYHMDESKMFAMGSMPQEAMDASLASIEILDYLVSQMKPGVEMGTIYDKAIKYAKKIGYEEEFLGLPGMKSKFVGHGIGVELVENPVIAKGRHAKLKPGMVFAVEPKMIFKNRFAAGIESAVHITENGANYLSTTENKVFICS